MSLRSREPLSVLQFVMQGTPSSFEPMFPIRADFKLASVSSFNWVPALGTGVRKQPVSGNVMTPPWKEKKRLRKPGPAACTGTAL
eukprot:193197-Pelagomonas_calceolata.AAC.7